MKGFKDSTRIRSGFRFPSSAGFTGSTGRTQSISYTRRTPKRMPKSAAGKEGSTVINSQSGKKSGVVYKAEGGRVVDSAMQGRVPPSSALDQESGSNTPLRPGFTRGGYAGKYKKGGMPKFAKGGRIPVEKIAAREAKTAVAKHVAYPAPKGHKGLKSC